MGATRRRVMWACAAACLMLMPTGCSGDDPAAAPSGSEASVTGTGLLSASAYPPGYQLLQGKSAAEVAQSQREIASNTTSPAECAQVFADQAARTASSQRSSVYVSSSDPGTPSFGNVLIRNGESLDQLRRVYQTCGNFTATVPNKGTLRMVYFDQPVQQQLPARDAYVVDTIVRTTPAPGSTSTPAVQNQVSGYAQLDNGRQVLFYAERYGAGNQVDLNQFNALFADAVRTAASVG